MKVLAEEHENFPDGVRIELMTCGFRVGPQVPVEVLAGIRRVILTITPAGQVADDPPLSLRRGPFRGPARKPSWVFPTPVAPAITVMVPGIKPPPEVPVERVNPKPLSRHDHPNSRSEKEKNAGPGAPATHALSVQGENLKSFSL